MSLAALLQSLRLYNRAIETATRLHPQQLAKSDPEEDNPFGEMTINNQTTTKLKPSYSRRNAMEGLEWRICDGLLNILFALAQAYFARGSAREAEYFAQQAQDLADAINTPTMVSRALARKGEIYLHTNRLDEGRECLMRAMELVDNRALAGVADLQRLRADYDMRNANPEAAQELYEQSIGMLDELQALFAAMDGSHTRSAVGPRPDSPCLTQSPDSQRKSDVTMRRISKAIEGGDAVLPFLLASVLRQQSELCRRSTTAYVKVFLQFCCRRTEDRRKSRRHCWASTWPSSPQPTPRSPRTVCLPSSLSATRALDLRRICSFPRWRSLVRR